MSECIKIAVQLVTFVRQLHWIGVLGSQLQIQSPKGTWQNVLRLPFSLSYYFCNEGRPLSQTTLSSNLSMHTY